MYNNNTPFGPRFMLFHPSITNHPSNPPSPLLSFVPECLAVCVCVCVCVRACVPPPRAPPTALRDHEHDFCCNRPWRIAGAGLNNSSYATSPSNPSTECGIGSESGRAVKGAACAPSAASVSLGTAPLAAAPAATRAVVAALRCLPSITGRLCCSCWARWSPPLPHEHA